VREFSGNKETKRVRAKSSNFRTEITGRFIEGEKDEDFRVVTKLSGAYSREDEIGKRKEAYSYNDYVVELTGKSPKSGGEPTLHMSIAGGYSVDTEPDSCVEGSFNFKTIKPVKSSGGQGYCGAESGEIEVNNAKMEFSSGKVKVSVENQQKEYRCEELGGLCKYEPITIAEGVEQKPCPVWFKDADKDGYTDGTTKVSCEKPSDEYISSETSWDCDDNDPNINPGKTEICDGKDNNCNGQTDEGNVCGSASTFAKKIGGSYDDGAYSIIQSSDGGYVVAGRTSSFSFGADIYDIYVVKMDANGNVCFSQNITNYSVSSNVGSFSSPSTVAISQSPTVSTISPTISSGGSVKDVCASAPAPYLCSANQDCGFGSAIATNRENVKSYGCSAGGVLSRFLIPASVPVIIYGWLRRKRKKRKGF
jgi:hypothetical protein